MKLKGVVEKNLAPVIKFYFGGLKGKREAGSEMEFDQDRIGIANEMKRIAVLFRLCPRLYPEALFPEGRETE